MSLIRHGPYAVTRPQHPPFPTPTRCDGACRVMLTTSTTSRQPVWVAWSRDRLYRERAIVLGYALDISTLHTYNSHLQSFLSFCKLHSLPLDPTLDTLSFFVVFMSHHIKPLSVMQYLSSIINSLEPYFPDVRKHRNHTLVTHTLVGMRKLWGFTGTTRKRALTNDDLVLLLDAFTSSDLDDLVFLVITFSSFHALLCLSESTQPDSPAKCSFRKIILRHSIKLTSSHFSFVLPTHKANCFFESSSIVIERRSGCLCPMRPFLNYLSAQDKCFPMHAPLWLRSTGKVPTYSWFIQKLKSCLGHDVAGHSMHSGGATTLTLAGTPDDHIQACGCWSSHAYHIYIRKYPVMLHSLLHRCSAFDTPS